MADRYKFRKIHRDQDLADIQREIQDNMVSFDKDGNVVIDADITCNDLITSGDSIYMGSKKKKNKLNVKADELYYNEIKITHSDQDKLLDPTGVGIAPHESIHQSGGYDELNHDDLAGFVTAEHYDWTDETHDLETTGSVTTVRLLAGGVKKI